MSAGEKALADPPPAPTDRGRRLGVVFDFKSNLMSAGEKALRDRPPDTHPKCISAIYHEATARGAAAPLIDTKVTEMRIYPERPLEPLAIAGGLQFKQFGIAA